MSVQSRESRARRMAAATGLMVVKSRRRDKQAEDYGCYVLVDDCTGNRIGRRGGQAAVSAFQDGWGMTLDQLERALK